MNDPEDLADGMALWAEHRPQTGEDWREVARRFIADGADTSQSSPLFAALVAEAQARQQAEQERDEARSQANDWARKAGEAQGALEASEWPGVVDGWRARAEAAEAERDRYREALQAALTICDEAHARTANYHADGHHVTVIPPAGRIEAVLRAALSQPGPEEETE
jgi:hypothetical protein